MNIYNRPPSSDYCCSECGAHGCKLWRQYNTFLDHIALLCVDCAGRDQDKDVSRANAEGKTPNLILPTDDHEVWTDSIGWLVPAVPTDDGSFWGYTSVPPGGVGWWRALPTRLTGDTP